MPKSKSKSKPRTPTPKKLTPKSNKKKASLKRKRTRKTKPTVSKKNHCYCFSDHPDFNPNLSPLEVLSQGAFGGTYFRPITSQVTNKKYKNRYQRYFTPQELEKYNIEIDTHLTKPYDTYQTQVNKYKVKCGQTLEQWENKDWITPHDPYGWFEWYCNFFKGRRIPEEDARQIKRWHSFCGEKGRYSQRLKNLVREKKTHPSDPNISPRIRQSLMHWGYELTPHNF